MRVRIQRDFYVLLYLCVYWGVTRGWLQTILQASLRVSHTKDIKHFQVILVTNLRNRRKTVMSQSYSNSLICRSSNKLQLSLFTSPYSCKAKELLKRLTLTSSLLSYTTLNLVKMQQLRTMYNKSHSCFCALHCCNFSIPLFQNITWKDVYKMEPTYTNSVFMPALYNSIQCKACVYKYVHVGIWSVSEPKLHMKIKSNKYLSHGISVVFNFCRDK